MSKHIFTADIDSSKKLFCELDNYMKENVLNEKDKFICQHEEECASSCRDKDINFYAGQLHHVGPLYDLKRDGKPFRIMISGGEYGKEAGLISVEKRTDIITGLNPGNPHMRGTLCLLQMLLGKEPQNGKLETTIDGESCRILAAFSLANFLLCRAGGKDSTGEEDSTGNPTEPMLKNCSNHFDATLKILQPDILITQGARSRDAKFFKKFYGIEKWIDLANPEPLKICIEGNKNKEGKQKETLLLPLYHPSYNRHPHELHKYFWGESEEARENYLKPAVKKLLEEYDKIYGA